MLFKDRTEAGRQLAEQLALRKPAKPVVLALPRGGVPVAYEVAVKLGAPLDLVLVRKIGAPWQQELAVGAVADGDSPELVVNEMIQAELGIAESYIRDQSRKQLKEIERRRRVYLGDRAPVPVEGCTAILVDDGIATGATVRAALRATRRRKPASIILAVPVAPGETIESLKHEADDVLCLHTPFDFAGVGQFYARFPQLEDEAVTELLQRRAAALASGGAEKSKSKNG